MSMAWMSARSEWRRRAGSLALLALLVTLAGGATIAAAAGARRADSAFQRFVDATGEPDVEADGFESPAAWTPESGDAAAPAFAEASALAGVVGGQRQVAVAVAATAEADPFSFALAEQGGDALLSFMVEGRMFDPDEPAEVVVNESGAAAFGVGVGDRLQLTTVGWDQLDTYLEQNAAASVERNGPRIEATVVGINRNAVEVAQQDDPFIFLGPAFVERYGDEVIHCTCIDLFVAASGEEERVLDEIESASTRRSATSSARRRKARCPSTPPTASTSR